MFLYEHPDHYVQRFADERERIERRTQLVRSLRGATPPFGEAIGRRLELVLSGR